MSVVLKRSRVSNALRCYVNYALSRLGLVRITHLPLFVSVEPAAVCQLRCPACPVGRRSLQPSAVSRQSFMSLDVWHRVLSEIRDTTLVVQFYFQGEPLLNKDLPQMIKEAHEAGLYTIVSTNAQAMTEQMAENLVTAGLDRIIVSMDGLSEASYNAYRIGGSLEKTKEALGFLRKAKEKFQISYPKGTIISNFKFQIELQCLRLKTNEHEWAQFKRQYKTLGADRLVFKTAQLYDYTHGHPLMPSDKRYSRYVLGKDGVYHRKKVGKGCFRVWSGAVITTNGDVLPCCYDKAHAHAYGNIMVSSLKDLFGNEKATAFRKAALNEQPQICQECWK